MFTCSCGIFDCGGFYVDVHYKKKAVIWSSERSSYKEYIFPEENIVLIANELIEKLTELNNILKENYHDVITCSFCLTNEQDCTTELQKSNFKNASESVVSRRTVQSFYREGNRNLRDTLIYFYLSRERLEP